MQQRICCTVADIIPPGKKTMKNKRVTRAWSLGAIKSKLWLHQMGYSNGSQSVVLRAAPAAWSISRVSVWVPYFGKWWCSRKKRQRNWIVTPVPPVLMHSSTSLRNSLFGPQVLQHKIKYVELLRSFPLRIGKNLLYSSCFSSPRQRSRNATPVPKNLFLICMEH